MASDIDAPRTRAQHARHPGVATARLLKSKPRPDPLTVHSIASYTSSISSSLKRKKSSESTSTGTAVTAPEDNDCGYGMRERDRSALVNPTAPSRPFITPRRSRPRMDDSRDSRSDRDPAAREPSRRHAHAHATFAVQPTTVSMQRRENEHASVDHGRRDKGKGVERSAASHTASSSRRFFGEPTEPSGDTARDRHHDRSDRHVYSGPLAHAEFERMRKEIESWKKAAVDYKKVAKKQAKKLEELKAQLLAETLAKNEQEKQVQALKAKVEKKEELITTIDLSLQCQICMDLLYRPYALSPCGHILCMHCLQEWFRKAPPSADDSDMDPNEQDDPHYILTRTKSCPCCRAVVTRRPVPVFVVKAVVTALAKYKMGAGGTAGVPSRRSPSPDQEDPWRGLFESSGDEGDEDGDEDEGDLGSSDEDEVYEDAIEWAMQGLHGGLHGELAHRLAINRRRYMLRYDDDDDSVSASGSGSEEDVDEDEDEDDGEEGDSLDEDGSDVYENVFVPAQWEPPRVTVDPEDYVFRNEGMASSTLRLLRRGCTLDMIRIFGMAYTHSRGLVAHLPSLDELWPFPDDATLNTVPRNHRVFLGWNVKLGEADYSGERYMRGVLTDLKENPARWTWSERTSVSAMPVRGAYDVKRLVRMEDVEDFDTTDTEVWLDANDPYHLR
ncbi:hypothetical protein D9615_003742 [Tricholomella constricta]|uniref:RING-type domain-containing protein n=1 Tax=Tricholomella constricta TaxID=117010 RepID=A0A8H5HHP5_9AGAR|nr:hypothetical protein D9615_003742 [Tricholomella constricta]